MVMSHVVPCAYANCLFTYVNEISLQVRVRELPGSGSYRIQLYHYSEVEARPQQSSPKVEHTLVHICMQKEGAFWFEAWSMDSNKMGVFLKENLHGFSGEGGIVTMFSP